ncbi:MAG: ParA family protein [Eggerthellaceae bacterium]|nr:ParA family protein [Eggerthellaceae bacterium]
MTGVPFGHNGELEEAARRCAASLTCDVPVVVVTGHYGVGKTNFSLNLALDAARSGRKVVLVDLDVVNPYFRSSEYRDQLEAEGVRVVAPVFAERGSNLDVPSLTGAITPAIESAQRDAGSNCSELVIVDAGGDDAGATALARFAPVVKAAPYKLLYVVNPFRNLTQEPHEALEVLREIEAKCGLAVSAVVSNAHLMSETDEEDVLAGVAFAREVAERAAVPLACATYPAACLRRELTSFSTDESSVSLYPIRIHVRTPWDAV